MARSTESCGVEEKPVKHFAQYLAPREQAAWGTVVHVLCSERGLWRQPGEGLCFRSSQSDHGSVGCVLPARRCAVGRTTTSWQNFVPRVDCGRGAGAVRPLTQPWQPCASAGGPTLRPAGSGLHRTCAGCPGCASEHPSGPGELGISPGAACRGWARDAGGEGRLPGDSWIKGPSEGFGNCQ